MPLVHASQSNADAKEAHYTSKTVSRQKKLEKSPKRPAGWVNIGDTHAKGKTSYNYGTIEGLREALHCLLFCCCFTSADFLFVLDLISCLIVAT